MIGGKSVLGLIPARGGSKRVPSKNLRAFNHPEFGKIPLLEIAIRVARQSKYIDHLLVSSDSEVIRTFAEALNCATLIRPPQLATDAAKSQHVALHAYFSLPSDLIALLQPTSPYRTAADIDACIEMWPAVSYNDSTSKINGAVYVTGPDCIYNGFHQKYMMPASRSLDIDTEQDLA